MRGIACLICGCHVATCILAIQSAQPRLDLRQDLRSQNDGNELDVASKFPWPVFYLHVPKTGGNFATTVAHTACEGCLPEAAAFIIGGVFQEYPSCCADKFNRFDGSHFPLFQEDFTSLPEPRYGHVITMLREPRQRLISGFYHNRHDCVQLKEQDAPGCIGDDVNSLPCLPLRNPATPEKLEAYATCVSNCSARMMSYELPRGTCGMKDAPPSIEDVGTAIDHMVRDYAFVGLTDHYELSVCLWHKRFGAPCLPVEFGDLRAGVRREDGMYDESVITDKADRELSFEKLVYEAAKQRFFSELKIYGVSRSTCQELCPEPAAVWQINTTAENLLANHHLFEYDWPGRLAFDLEG